VQRAGAGAGVEMVFLIGLIFEQIERIVKEPANPTNPADEKVRERE